MTPTNEILLTEYLGWLNKVNLALDGKEWFTELTPDDAIHEETLAHYNDGWYDVLALKVGFGDEGGHHVITGWFYDDELLFALQGFDTEIGIWKKDGKLVNTEGF